MIEETSALEGAMQHARIATYRLTGGSFESVAARAEQGLLEVFRRAHGFRAYGLVRVDHAQLVSISLWATEAQAHDAATTAAAWVDEHLADEVRLEASHIGDVAFWASAVPADAPAMQTPIPS